MKKILLFIAIVAISLIMFTSCDDAPAKYQVTFDANDGTFTGSDSVIEQTFGSKYKIPAADPTRDGYTFDGWYKGTNKIESTTTVEITSDITLTAKWTAKTYQVTFNTNGAIESTTPISVDYASTYGTLPTVTKTGYTFDGWYNGTNKIESTTTVNITSDITLTAKWTANTNTTYTVKHMQQNIENDSYTEVATEDLTGTTAALTAANAKTYTGFTAKGITQLTIKADGSTVIEVKYDRNKYTVTYNLDGNTNTVIAQSNIKYEAKINKPSDPDKIGHTLDGWYKDSGCTTAFDFNTAIIADITLYAKWEVTYTISFDNNDATGTMPNQTFTKGDSANLSDNTFTAPEGLDFWGWSTEIIPYSKDLTDAHVNHFDDVDYFDKAAITPTSDMTLYAIWGKKVNYSGNGVSGIDDLKDNIGEVVIQSNVNGQDITTINKEAFFIEYKGGFPGLTKITIPESIKNIEKHAFKTCKNLMEVTLPSEMTSIKDEAFYMCTSLQNIIIPDGINNDNFGNYVFYNCDVLNSISIPAGLTLKVNFDINNYTWTDGTNTYTNRDVITPTERITITKVTT